jgi:hypothetical protein
LRKLDRAGDEVNAAGKRQVGEKEAKAIADLGLPVTQPGDQDLKFL